jgi:hypothetical protein
VVFEESSRGESSSFEQPDEESRSGAEQQNPEQAEF